MNFEFSGDQKAFVEAVQGLVARHAGGGNVTGPRFHLAADLDRDLDAAGFFGALQIEELGRVGAAAMVMEISRLPQVAEIVASSFIGPTVCPEWPRPYALLWDDLRQATRFLPTARTVIGVRHREVQVAALREGDVETIDSVFAYPVGTLRDPLSLTWQPATDADAGTLRDLWRTGIAAEIVGCLDAGLQAVLAHVKDRRQFGQPLGSFQALQHRLAECATLIEGARWLTLKAADTALPLDIATATAQAQHIVAKVTFDLHQFMGAMGLTLEHPLHRWTYRAKLLRLDLGGTERHFIAAAEAAWSTS